MKISYKINAEEFYTLRKSVNWKDVGASQLSVALENSMYVVGIYENDSLVAYSAINTPADTRRLDFFVLLFSFILCTSKKLN